MIYCRIPLYLGFNPDKIFSKHKYIKSLNRYIAFKTALISYAKISARIRATAMKDKLPDSVFLTKCMALTT